MAQTAIKMPASQNDRLECPLLQSVEDTECIQVTALYY